MDLKFLNLPLSPLFPSFKNEMPKTKLPRKEAKTSACFSQAAKIVGHLKKKEALEKK